MGDTCTAEGKGCAQARLLIARVHRETEAGAPRQVCGLKIKLEPFVPCGVAVSTT